MYCFVFEMASVRLSCVKSSRTKGNSSELVNSIVLPRQQQSTAELLSHMFKHCRNLHIFNTIFKKHKAVTWPYLPGYPTKCPTGTVHKQKVLRSDRHKHYTVQTVLGASFPLNGPHGLVVDLFATSKRLVLRLGHSAALHGRQGSHGRSPGSQSRPTAIQCS